MAVVIGLILAAAGVAIGLAIDWFPVQASAEAKKIDQLYDVLIIASVPIFVLVATVVGFSVWKFHMRPGEEELDGPPIHGNTRVEIVWTTLPALMLIGLCSYAYVVLHDIEAKAATDMTVEVTGEQFAWHFEYPRQDGIARRVKTDQLYLPKGKQVNFKVRSKDVIHDFWVPAFRQKIDAVPGITTAYRITPTRQGAYVIVCAELCGLGHSTMRQTVHVLSQNGFDAWISRQTRRPAGA